MFQKHKLKMSTEAWLPTYCWNSGNFCWYPWQFCISPPKLFQVTPEQCHSLSAPVQERCFYDKCPTDLKQRQKCRQQRVLLQPSALQKRQCLWDLIHMCCEGSTGLDQRNSEITCWLLICYPQTWSPWSVIKHIILVYRWKGKAGNRLGSCGRENASSSIQQSKHLEKLKGQISPSEV